MQERLQIHNHVCLWPIHIHFHNITYMTVRHTVSVIVQYNTIDIQRHTVSVIVQYNTIDIQNLFLTQVPDG